MEAARWGGQECVSQAPTGLGADSGSSLVRKVKGKETERLEPFPCSKGCSGIWVQNVVWGQGCILYSVVAASQNSSYLNFEKNPYPNLGQVQSVTAHSSRQNTGQIPALPHPENPQASPF